MDGHALLLLQSMVKLGMITMMTFDKKRLMIQ
jgi:hypothetical protein